MGLQFFCNEKVMVSPPLYIFVSQMLSIFNKCLKNRTVPDQVLFKANNPLLLTSCLLKFYRTSSNLSKKYPSNIPLKLLIALNTIFPSSVQLITICITSVIRKRNLLEQSQMFFYLQVITRTYITFISLFQWMKSQLNSSSCSIYSSLTMRTTFILSFLSSASFLAHSKFSQNNQLSSS